MNWRLSRNVAIREGRISAEDARRQALTAAEILRRLDHQPGVILADEVGMGKTFVALAVAASTIEATGGEKSVVVMVPPGVQDKWPREWDVFRQTCLKRDAAKWIRATPTAVNRPARFFQLLDDPPDRRQHLIFLTHGALTNALNDPFTRLALVRRGLQRRHLARQRAVFPRWAERLLPGTSYFRDEKLVAALLESNPRTWRAVLRRAKVDLPDDPVPDALLRVLPRVDVSPLADALADLPLRTSSYADQRLRRTRQELAPAVQSVWRGCMREMNVELPLLILDEAHHLKNRWTRFSSLFEAPEAEKDADLLRGAFGGVFDRMLFLTATPFQLGHHELTEVLRRFTAVRWGDGIARGVYETQLEELERALTAAQTAALRLDRAWSWLQPPDVVDLSNEWWNRADIELFPETVRSVMGHVREVQSRGREAEHLLRPWVIRHVRPDRERRRRVLAGRAIRNGATGAVRGLEVGGPAVLPFLLAARVQSLVALDHRAGGARARAYFSEGLASSFEAYRDTRIRQQARDMVDDAEANEVAETPLATRWYLDHLDSALPLGSEAALRKHPKVEATVSRTLELWKTGEKVVVFCFYIATGRALRAHISHAIQAELVKEGARKLGLEPRQRAQVVKELERLGDRFFDPDAPVTKLAASHVGEIFSRVKLDKAERDESVEVVLRFLRTPTFLVRYVDLGARDEAAALESAFEQEDASGRSLGQKIESFSRFVADRVPEERLELLSALRTINTGAIFTSGDAIMDGESVDRRPVVPNVRLANGEVSREARRRLMLAFNTPFFPEILVSSAVMGEGVDLHLECRHTIHHDLDWNPSTLEQRTGRLDRLGSKSETTNQPIVVYEPFLEGTQDEKQYRVVKDRERWFNVVMGEKLELDEAATDRLAERVDLPLGLAKRLALRLEIDRTADP